MNCPNCKSTDISTEESNGLTKATCQDCLASTLFPSDSRPDEEWCPDSVRQAINSQDDHAWEERHGL